jgi:hypothetical protein
MNTPKFIKSTGMLLKKLAEESMGNTNLFQHQPSTPFQQQQQTSSIHANSQHAQQLDTNQSYNSSGLPFSNLPFQASPQASYNYAHNQNQPLSQMANPLDYFQMRINNAQPQSLNLPMPGSFIGFFF